eukprot:TRINITY_DN3315_c0_g1_i1.p2 TRINITY_DN3315_c0_g1~~TRINITY_DN3315_c0_g1_i1.p2  ORF type:complete len:116 (-),score=25.61 TRINITY_DN3315_c0_g1_i1:154-501(-)
MFTDLKTADGNRVRVCFQVKADKSYKYVWSCEPAPGRPVNTAKEPSHWEKAACLHDVHVVINAFKAVEQPVVPSGVGRIIAVGVDEMLDYFGPYSGRIIAALSIPTIQHYLEAET